MIAGEKKERIKKSGRKQNGTYLKQLVFLAVISFLFHIMTVSAHRQILQQGIAEEVLRFHVIANSDSIEDQQIKLLIRDEILAWSNGKTEEDAVNGKEDTEAFFRTHLEEIEEISNQILQKNGFEYQAAVRITQCYFPDRRYGECIFPAGWYQAVRIELGNAKGQNWWCVLYPELCFRDCLHAVAEEEQMKSLEKVLTAEEYDYLLDNPRKWHISFRWFK